jgi:flagellar assembly protein FliH
MTMYNPVALVDARLERRGFQASPFNREVQFERRMSATVSAPDDYARGFEDGKSIAATAFASERTELLALVTAATNAAPQPSEELTALIATTVERLVGEIVGRTAIDRDWLTEQVRRACLVIADCDAAQTMWLHPGDAALMAGSDLTLDIREDSAAQRGSIRIDCSAGWIEQGRSAYLDALHEALS